MFLQGILFQGLNFIITDIRHFHNGIFVECAGERALLIDFVSNPGYNKGEEGAYAV